jgi:cytochrome c peroxidase
MRSLRRLALALGQLFLCSTAIAQSPLGPAPAPAGNPTTPAKAVLGKILFFEEQLSDNGRVACATCHLPEFGGGDSRRRRNPGDDGIPFNADDTFGSPGIERLDASGLPRPDARFGFDEQVTDRASPSVAMAAWFNELLWDGSRDGTLRDPETNVVVLPNGAALENQSLHPLRSDVEMAREGRSWAQIRQRVATLRPLALASNLPPDVQQALATSPDYPSLFAAAFGDANVTMPRIAMALGAYQRSAVPDQTPWDLHAAGVPNALTPQQLQGLQIYQGDARCDQCHPLGLFTDGSFRALGLVPVTQDPGRGGVTGNPQDLGSFKTPSVRNAALKTTFLHTGRFTTMAQVVNFYNNGGGTFTPRDSLLQPLDLDQQEIVALLDFLENGLVDPRARLRLPPFDRPTLFAESNPRGANLFGAATPGGGFTPNLLANSVPWLGNPEWALGVHAGPPAGVGMMLLSVLPAPPGIVASNVLIHVDPATLLFAVPVSLDATGRGGLVLPVPVLPAFAGLPLAAQALLTPTNGPPAWSGTRGATFALR